MPRTPRESYIQYSCPHLDAAIEAHNAFDSEVHDARSKIEDILDSLGASTTLQDEIEAARTIADSLRTALTEAEEELAEAYDQIADLQQQINDMETEA